MKKLALALGLAVLTTGQAAAQFTEQELAQWEQQAERVTIIRDDWGIAHIYGPTDADAVFGMIYAQAEDDFNRVENNYITQLGRSAEADGESRIFQDLRWKIFSDPEQLQREYAESPAWLRTLMDSWAAGLNFYLATHPEVTPRVITRFEPWMALSFSEGSIGGDVSSVSVNQLQAFYGGTTFRREPSPRSRRTWIRVARTASRSLPRTP